MSLVPAVTELLLAEFMYLQYDNPTRPIYLYINSTGVQARHRSAYGLYAVPATFIRTGCHAQPLPELMVSPAAASLA